MQSLINPKGPAGKGFAYFEQGKISVAVSRDTLAEVREVLSRPHLRVRFRQLTDAKVAELAKLLLYKGYYLRRVGEHFTYPRDSDDEPYLNLAIEVEADYLVSRDHDLLDLMEVGAGRRPRVSAAFSHGIPTTANVWLVAFKGNAFFVTSNGTGVFRLTDGGNSFVSINTGLTVQLTRGLLVVGDTLFLASNAIYRSTDNGNTWMPLFNGPFDSLTRNGNTIYAVGPSVGSYMSRDNGDTWQVNNSGLFGVVRQIASSSNQIVAASRGSGVFFQPVDDFAAVSAASFSPNAVAE